MLTACMSSGTPVFALSAHSQLFFVSTLRSRSAKISRSNRGVSLGPQSVQSQGLANSATGDGVVFDDTRDVFGRRPSVSGEVRINATGVVFDELGINAAGVVCLTLEWTGVHLVTRGWTEDTAERRERERKERERERERRERERR